MWFTGEDLIIKDSRGDFWMKSNTSVVSERLNFLQQPDDRCNEIFVAGEEVALEKHASGGATQIAVQLVNSSKKELFPVPKDAGSCSTLAYSTQNHVGVRVPLEYIDMLIFEPKHIPAFRSLSNPLHDKSGLRQVIQQPTLSDDGTVMAGIARGHGVALFDVSEGRIIGTLSAPDIQSLAMSGDGKHLVTYENHVGVVIWDLDADKWASTAERISGSDSVE